MLEVETKIRVADLSLVRRRLGDLGAKQSGVSTQRDVYLNAPYRDFAVTDEALRIRYTDDFTEVTYKGAKIPTSGLKTRPEVNLHVDSGERFEELMQGLGFTPVAEVKKTREEYRWKGASIALDEVEGLGTFVEIEVITEKSAASAERLVEEIQKEIGIEGPHITVSYLEMLLATQTGARS
jgi:adenylate cyclase class 2